MSITARCPACQKLFKAEDTWLGKKVKCRGCATVFSVAPDRVGNEPKTTTAADGFRQVLKPATTPARPPATLRNAPVRRPTVKPPIAPAASDVPEDPFAELDGLADLEASGTIVEPEAIIFRRRRTGVETELEEYEPIVSADPNFLSYGRAPQSPFVEIPGEENIDKYLPWVPVGIFLAMLGMVIYRGISRINEQVDAYQASNDVRMEVISKFLAVVAVFVVAIGGVLAPLCLAGVFTASKIMKFDRPESLYLKCLAVMCTPLSLAFAFNGFTLDEHLAAVSWWIAVPIMLCILWLLVRLRAIPFLVTVGCVCVLAIGVPYAVITMTLPASVLRSHNFAPRPIHR